MYWKPAVAYERLFISVGNIVNKRRSSLKPNRPTVNMLVCLHCWLSDDI